MALYKLWFFFSRKLLLFSRRTHALSPYPREVSPRVITSSIDFWPPRAKSTCVQYANTHFALATSIILTCVYFYNMYVVFQRIRLYNDFFFFYYLNYTAGNTVFKCCLKVTRTLLQTFFFRRTNDIFHPKRPYFRHDLSGQIFKSILVYGLEGMNHILGYNTGLNYVHSHVFEKRKSFTGSFTKVTNEPTV